MSNATMFVGYDSDENILKDRYGSIILFPSANLARIRGAHFVARTVRCARITQVEKRAIIALVSKAAKLSHEDATGFPQHCSKD